VSCVQGRPVTRYGTRTFIGADRDLLPPHGMTYDTERVVAISQAEFSRYRREYNRAVNTGDLVKRTAAEWSAQQQPAAKPANEKKGKSK